MKLELRARAFARAYLNVFNATSDDEDRPALYRTMLMEVFDTGVRLVATDSYLLLRSWVPIGLEDAGIEEPGTDEAPAEVYIVSDIERRVKALMAWLWSSTKGEDKGEPIEPLVVHLAKLTDPDRPTLSPDLERDGISFVTTNERVTVPLSGIGFPAWRTISLGDQADKGGIRVRGELLRRVSQAGSMDGTPIWWLSPTKTSLLVIESDAVPSLVGLLAGCIAPERATKEDE